MRIQSIFYLLLFFALLIGCGGEANYTPETWDLRESVDIEQLSLAPRPNLDGVQQGQRLVTIQFPFDQTLVDLPVADLQVTTDSLESPTELRSATLYHHGKPLVEATEFATEILTELQFPMNQFEKWQQIAETESDLFDPIPLGKKTMGTEKIGEFIYLYQAELTAHPNPMLGDSETNWNIVLHLTFTPSY